MPGRVRGQGSSPAELFVQSFGGIRFSFHQLTGIAGVPVLRFRHAAFSEIDQFMAGDLRIQAGIKDCVR